MATASSKEAKKNIESWRSFPLDDWTRLRASNALERIMGEIRRRTRVVGNFSDGKSALMLVAAGLRHIAGTKWGRPVYLDMARLHETEQAAGEVAVA
jgi:putative transposase